MAVIPLFHSPYCHIAMGKVPLIAANYDNCRTRLCQIQRVAIGLLCHASELTAHRSPRRTCRPGHTLSSTLQLPDQALRSPLLQISLSRSLSHAQHYSINCSWDQPAPSCTSPNAGGGGSRGDVHLLGFCLTDLLTQWLAVDPYRVPACPPSPGEQQCHIQAWASPFFSQLQLGSFQLTQFSTSITSSLPAWDLLQGADLFPTGSHSTCHMSERVTILQGLT